MPAAELESRRREVDAPSRWKACAGAAVLVATMGSAAQAHAEAADVAHIVENTGNRVEQTAIVVERLSDGQTWTSNEERAEERFSPASTSKIPHTLIALEGGFADTSTVFPWDGVVRGSRKWNQDQTLASAFQVSAVWVYQEIARTAGHLQMSKGLADFGYGNSDVGSIDHLTTYWLDDTLKISAVEQVAFLANLVLEQLPIDTATYEAAKDIMVSDKGPGWVMRSKTGWRYSETSMDIGWHVGWVQCAEETYVFALNIDMPDTLYLSRRTQITYAVLEDIGAFDCE